MTNPTRETPPPAKPSAVKRARERRDRIRQSRRSFSRKPILVISGLGLVVLALLVARSHWIEKARAEPVPLVVCCVDGEGRAQGDVEVTFHRRDQALGEPILRVRTDPEGKAVIPKEIATGGWFCVGRSEQLASVSQCYIEQGDAMRTMTLDAPEPIEGFVVDELGQPIPGVHADARLNGGPILETVLSDDAGRFVFRTIATNLIFIEINARHRGHANAMGTWQRNVGGTLRLELQKTKPLILRIVDPEGLPIAKLPVSIVTMPDHAGSTDASGEIRFDGLVHGEYYWLKIEHPALTYRHRPYSPRSKAHRVRLQEPATLEAMAVDAGGTPRPGIEIRHRHGPRRWVRVQTDSEGRFRIGDLPRGIVKLHWESNDDEGSVEVEIRAGVANKLEKLILEGQR